eukprot:CAMPEP_0113267640 /NCGR_PEP_ID=MMETSP0008_2-20120614/20716_1 /TAXON_ID=97485 /ORGANISM="Prymnesium parvum" /LENGTH=134 /DNA_ID=CAMNT_0000116685 /DNA_START=44 /DNA_END=449 /DNA_ORIENTATION=+ /assembly_acc=CAM_ASM_000153
MSKDQAERTSSPSTNPVLNPVGTHEDRVVPSGTSGRAWKGDRGGDGWEGGERGQTHVDHAEYGHLLFKDKDEWMRNLLQSLSAVTNSNIDVMLVTLLVSQSSGWLKLLAPWNITLMLLTLLVSQLSGWLKLLAP